MDATFACRHQLTTRVRRSYIDSTLTMTESFLPNDGHVLASLPTRAFARTQ